MQKFRFLSQIAFLAVFVTLMVIGKAQFWMAFIFASILLAAIFGRYYCGWACPINTLMIPTNKLGKKLKTQRETPLLLKSGTPRIVVFIIFLGALGYTIYSITQGHKFPLPLIIIPFGLLVTLFINPTSWHRYLCPWGSFFSLTSRFSRLGIKPVSCISCHSCESTCPTESIAFKQGKAEVDSANCLLCLNCLSNCKEEALKYSSLNKLNRKVPVATSMR